MNPPVDFQRVADIPGHFAALVPDKAAAIFEGRELSFGALDRLSNRIAARLAGAGLRKGGRVAVLAKDSDRFLATIFGIAKAGGVFVGINWRLAPPEIAFILEDSEAEIAFVGPEFVPRVAASRSSLKNLRELVSFADGGGGALGFDAWLEGPPGVLLHGASTAEEPVAQLYTSGTTGRPKGVVLANRSFFAIVNSLRAASDPWLGWGETDVFATALPFFHIGGIWFLMTGLSFGATCVVFETFVAWKVLELIARHGITKICMVPAMIGVALDEPGSAAADLSSLTHVVYGGSPIPKPVLEKAIARFRCGFAQIYGLTETGNTAVCLRPEDHRGRPELLAAAGRPYPGVRIKILDETGRPLPPGRIGEICIHSPANMLEYWKREDATRKTLIGGWIHTGDAGFLDEEGYVFVSDRVKDMIISAGENIYPAEIESVLAAHPAVAEAAVIGVPDDRWGERVKALVVLRPGSASTPADLIAHCRPHLAEFKLPRSIDFVDALPRTPSGKIKKAELREPFWRGRERRV